MKAVVFHGIGDIRLDSVKEPDIKHEFDAIVRLTASAICGTDLHFVRGTVPGMQEGTILGHEGVGVVEEVGKSVRNVKPGDRAVIASTIACGSCVYCRAGFYAQCDKANPNGKLAGTAFFGGPKDSGPFNGLQAEYARVPFANVGLIKLPGEVTDDQAILTSDIFPTGYFAADIANLHPGCTVAVFGCGPVGQFVIASCKLLGAGRVIAVDTIDTRLEMAQDQGAEIINFSSEDPVQAIRDLTDGIGVDRAVDAVGVDANRPSKGPAHDREKDKEFDREVQKIAPQRRPDHGNWNPGAGPSQALQWAVDALAKAGTLSVIGVYPESAQTFPIGKAMDKNLSVRMGNCNHRKYIPKLVDMIRTGVFNPSAVLTNLEPLTSAIEAYKLFDRREPGWIKVELLPAA
jgi:threonine dehydrogenase-like Zn-dependent dehydrogenase